MLINLTNLPNLPNLMIYTLKSFNTGQITLPKSWRDKQWTTNFVAEETKDGLLIKPLRNSNDVFYEDEHWFGLYSEKGLDTQKIISTIKKLRDG